MPNAYRTRGVTGIRNEKCASLYKECTFLNLKMFPAKGQLGLDNFDRCLKVTRERQSIVVNSRSYYIKRLQLREIEVRLYKKYDSHWNRIDRLECGE